MTKTGTEKPSTEKDITRKSTQDRCRHAAITPIGTARATEITIVISAMFSVGPRRSPIIPATEVFDSSDVPRSPRNSWPIHVPNCTSSGSFSPRLSRMRSSCAGVAASPARIAAGSPGVSRSKRNTKIATITITGIVANMRLRI